MPEPLAMENSKGAIIYTGSFVVSDVLCRSGAVVEFSFPAIREELRPNQLCFY